jgi:hypothetical protein
MGLSIELENLGRVVLDDKVSALRRHYLGSKVLSVKFHAPHTGIAPTHELAGLLDRAGYRGYLSLEVFVASYGAESALEIAR